MPCLGWINTETSRKRHRPTTADYKAKGQRIGSRQAGFAQTLPQTATLLSSVRFITIASAISSAAAA
jgi:hypothetical protein